MSKNPSAYDFNFLELETGAPLALRQFHGKVMMIVNTASRCGFTSQYEGLEKLYRQYKDQGFVIIGVPSNDFKNQEPGNSEEIKQFCSLNYDVTFPMTRKESVSGPHAHPFYQWARKSLGFSSAPKWNFHKYLINRQGEIVDYFYTFRRPDRNVIQRAVEKYL